MQDKSWELTPEQKIEANKRNEMQYLYAYSKYVMQQEEQFRKIMEFVNTLINNMKENADISEYVELRARIKAARSALANDAHKTLDDAFGMEIVTTTEEEIDIILEELERWMKSTKVRNHDKPNGYKAKHRVMDFDDDKLERIGIQLQDAPFVPLIEYQLKT